MKKFYIILLAFFLIFRLSAQSQGIALNLGYTYVNTNAGYIGGEYSYRLNPSDWQGITLGAGAYYGSFNHNFKFIPEAHLSLTQYLFLGEFSITPHNINPSLGFHFLNTLRLKMGYSWKIGNENRKMEGITFGINYLLGTKGFYDKFDIR